MYILNCIDLLPYTAPAAGRFSVSQLAAFQALSCGRCPLLSRVCQRRSGSEWRRLALQYVREEAALAQRQVRGMCGATVRTGSPSLNTYKPIYYIDINVQFKPIHVHFLLWRCLVT